MRETIDEIDKELLLLLARGRTTSQIAVSLHISESTAKTYIKWVEAKMNAHTRAQAVANALREGVIQ